MKKATFCGFCQSNAKFKLGLKTCSFRNSSENFIALTLEAITQYRKISSACHTISYWWQLSYGTTYKMDNRFRFGFCRRAHTFAWANTPFPPPKKKKLHQLFLENCKSQSVVMLCVGLHKPTTDKLLFVKPSFRKPPHKMLCRIKWVPKEEKQIATKVVHHNVRL